MRDRTPRDTTDPRLRSGADALGPAGEPMPADIAGLDRLLARTLAGERSIDDARLARIVAASVEALPAPDAMPIRRWQPLRRARVAIAAAAVIALAAGSVVTLRQSLPDRAGGTAIVLEPEPVQQSAPADPTRPGAAEATLIALLTDADAGQSSWIDDRAFGGTAAARAVAPVLQTRGAGIDDLFAELGSVFGALDS